MTFNNLSEYDFHNNWTPENSDAKHLIEAIRQTNELLKYCDNPLIIHRELDRLDYLRKLLAEKMSKAAKLYPPYTKVFTEPEVIALMRDCLCTCGWDNTVSIDIMQNKFDKFLKDRKFNVKN